MTLNRVHAGRPSRVAAIDLNSEAAFLAANEPIRSYPGLFPIPDTVIAWSGETLTLLPWQRNLWMHAELVMLLSRDVAAGEVEQAQSAVLGYSLGLAFWDDSALADLRRGSARDRAVNTLYGHYLDGSRRQSSMLLAPTDLPPLRDLVLELSVSGREPVIFPQADLINDGPAVLREATRLISFRRGDAICLGPAAAPLILLGHERLPAGSQIIVSAPPFEPVVVSVVDHRDPSREYPWPGAKP